MIVPKTVERVCKHCKSTFSVPANRSKQAYCGYSCASKDRARISRPVTDRFWEKVNRDGPVPAARPELGRCWEWLGAPMQNGYGRVFIEKRDGRRNREQYAHRFAYELLVGPIPEGLAIDHLCRNRMCVNPEHLEPVTDRENTRRGQHPSAVVARSNSCSKGHERTEANVYTTPEGYKQCRVCNRENARARKAKRRIASGGN